MMTGAIFANTLRRGMRTAVWWGLGMAGLLAIQIIVLKDSSLLQQTADLLKAIPPFLLQAIGGTSDLAYMATPSGYLALQFYGFIILVYAAYSVLAGLNVTANDEEAGVMDVFLSLPVSRTRLILEKTLSFTVLSVIVVAFTLCGLLLSLAATPNIAWDIGSLVLATINILPGMLMLMAGAILAGALFRRRGTAVAVCTIFIIASYFLTTFALAAPGTILDSLRWLSFMSYYDATGVMQHGLNWGNITVLLLAGAGMLGAATWRYERRDIGL